jgi:hypothetical protein
MILRTTDRFERRLSGFTNELDHFKEELFFLTLLQRREELNFQVLTDLQKTVADFEKRTKIEILDMRTTLEMLEAQIQIIKPHNLTL